MDKINNWICKKVGHKFDSILLAMFDIEHKSALNGGAGADETITCKRCKKVFGHKFN